ncbi:hypothetical protein BgiMline_017951, partial [Biomphalaria glabrata]
RQRITAENHSRDHNRKLQQRSQQRITTEDHYRGSQQRITTEDHYRGSQRAGFDTRPMETS